MNDELMFAILSMDAYNRNKEGDLDPKKIDVPAGAGTSLGDATFKNAEEKSLGFFSSGFFAASWTYSGKTVIAYRGTDDLADIRAWQQFLGSPFSTQGQEALQFYKDNNGGSLAYNPNIVLELR